jgi:hypothetical protein
MARIYVRSPYIIEINVPLQQSTSIELYIWNGTGAAPLSPQYTLSKNVPSASNVQTLYNISNYVREYLTHSSVQSIYNSTAATPTTQWCNVQVVKYSDGVLVGTESHNAFDGYGYYSEGSNFDNGISSLDDGTYYYYNTGVTPVTNPLYYAGFFRASAIALGTVVYTNLRTLATQSTTSFNTPYDYPCVYDQWYNDGNKVEVKNAGGTVLNTFYFRPISECRYDVVTCDFVNKSGAWQRTFFYKASQETLEVDNAEYNLMQTDSLNYSIYEGQRQVFNANGKEFIRVNTGFVNDDYAEVLRQLMLSERIMINNQPAKVRTKSLEKQKQINTKMINYTLEFDYSFDTINSVV